MKTQLLTESFLMDDGRSIRRLHRNAAGMEVSGHSYLTFIRLQLRKRAGFMTDAQLVASAKRNFGPVWGPDDVRLMQVGLYYHQPKWRNTLAWAKVCLRKGGEVAQRRSCGATVIVLLKPVLSDEHQALIRWVRGRRVKRMPRLRWLLPGLPKVDKIPRIHKAAAPCPSLQVGDLTLNRPVAG